MHLLERNAQQEFDDGSRPFVSNRVRVEMPADTLDEELLRALLDESALSRAMRGVTSNLVEKLSDTLKGMALSTCSWSTHASLRDGTVVGTCWRSAAFFPVLARPGLCDFDPVMLL